MAGLRSPKTHFYYRLKYENSIDRSAWQAPWGHKESDTTFTHTHTHTQDDNLQNKLSFNFTVTVV